ncbi:hypothetical protein M441DRAFT_337407 [Trichoderma asperellum CBS 433.97]|uniref:Uncharacterized protein n=1 Tax=Trichoderma asperellum (strain ATCC 204424 / CBS 433.97 / NBRC 101777) TaxID=1042311 RepID=A0A2T3ZGK3_TRIA4|nr:hypothetical protein M441DRAFT_337407 [Trichoderma asperellum CBS 433.97]PTB43920.1 hypothetical protein M441DRAFT_337407 [Trichoderma asperellum CBS 433.97]
MSCLRREYPVALVKVQRLVLRAIFGFYLSAAGALFWCLHLAALRQKTEEDEIMTICTSLALRRRCDGSGVVRMSMRGEQQIKPPTSAPLCATYQRGATPTATSRFDTSAEQCLSALCVHERRASYRGCLDVSDRLKPDRRIISLDCAPLVSRLVGFGHCPLVLLLMQDAPNRTKPPRRAATIPSLRKPRSHAI